MANEQNLRHLSTREAREIGSKGGKASVKSRRKSKSMKDAMNKLLSLGIQNEANIELLKNMGFEDEDMNNQVVIAVALFNRAASGDVSAARLIADLTGSYAMSESEKQKIKLEKERLKLEKEKSKHMPDGQEKVVIINDLPK